MTPAVPLFDAHCDTILKLVDHDVDFFNDGAAAHVTFPGMRRAGLRAQVFACFVLRERHSGTERQRAFELLDALAALAASHPDDLRIVTTGEQLTADDSAPIGMLLGLEGADPLVGGADDLTDFHRRGVRWVIPAWKDNLFAGTAFGENTGLTDEGRDLVRLAEELRVVVDVSHLSDRAFADTVETGSRPLVASHSNCRSLCPTLRNLTDEMIRTLADRGGVLGINFFPGFLDPTYHQEMRSARQRLRAESEDGELRFRAWVAAAPRPAADWIARHVIHALRVGGEDCVGLGADLDGVTSLPEGIDSVADLAGIPALLDEAGLSARQIEKVCWENMRRTVTAILGDD